MDKNVPIINSFEQKENPMNNKFIQIYIDGRPYFRFIDPEKMRFHFEILNSVLKDEFGIVPENNLGGIPKIKGKRYEMVGAGKFYVEGDKIILYDKSHHYLIRPNEEHAEKISNLTGFNLFAE